MYKGYLKFWEQKKLLKHKIIKSPPEDFQFVAVFELLL